MRVKQLAIGLLLLAATASVARSQTASLPIIATPIAAPSAYPTGPGAPYTPGQIQQAYGVNSLFANMPNSQGAGQTIAIVDAYNYPGALATINSFCSTFNSIGDGAVLPLMTSATFTQLNETGGTALPGTDPAGSLTMGATSNWELEEALDMEWAHVMAPKAKIILYEAGSDSYSDLFQAVSTAKNNGAVSVVSMSFGGGEFGGETGNDLTFTTPAGRLAANPKQGVTFVASTGDNGAPGGYPAFSPNVVAVGGTSLTLAASNTPTGTVYQSETAWGSGAGTEGGGGGTSTQEPKPAYQVSTGTLHGTVLKNITTRGIPDVSLDADPNLGVYDYDSYNGGFFEIGGTSLSAPCWAGLIADADGIRSAEGFGTLDGISQTLPALYTLPNSDFTDITTGNNGFPAGPGYDLATGLGTPRSNSLVPDLANYKVVPEPSTFVLLGAGFIGLFGWMRRQRT